MLIMTSSPTSAPHCLTMRHDPRRRNIVCSKSQRHVACGAGAVWVFAAVHRHTMATHRVTVQVLGTGTHGSPAGLYLAVERLAKYGSDSTLVAAAVVNPGDGTRRYLPVI